MRQRRASTASAVLWLGLIYPEAPSAYRQRPPETLPPPGRCADAVRAQLREWSVALNQAVSEPPSPVGERAVLIPTAVIGVWVRMTSDSTGEVGLERVTAHDVDSRRFGPTCDPVASRENRPPASEGFTDASLATRLAQGDAGVILVWSPHMPLSVDQYEILVAVTKELDLSLITLLDPGAEVDYARRIAGERHMPASAVQPIGGIELAFRGMTTHAPSVQVFADGKLKGRVLFGYRSHDAARLAIAEVLQGR